MPLLAGLVTSCQQNNHVFITNKNARKKLSARLEAQLRSSRNYEPF